MFNDHFHIYIPLNRLFRAINTTPTSSPNHVYTENIIYCEYKTDTSIIQIIYSKNAKKQ